MRTQTERDHYSLSLELGPLKASTNGLRKASEINFQLAPLNQALNTNNKGQVTFGRQQAAMINAMHNRQHQGGGGYLKKSSMEVDGEMFSKKNCVLRGGS